MKKLVLLAVFPSVAETYDNVKLILDEMDIEAVEFSVSAVQYNCPFCDSTAPFTAPYDLYTFDDLMTWHQVNPLHFCI